MLKKALSFLTAVSLFCLIALPAQAISSDKPIKYTYGDFKYYILADNTVAIADYLGYNNETQPEHLTVPSEINGKKVTQLGKYTFHPTFEWSEKNSTVPTNALKTITLPDTITEIGRFAFWGCTNLTEIIIPDSVTKIEGSAFLGCTNLKKVTLSKNLKSLGFSALQNTAIKKIVLPDSIKAIKGEAFAHCKSLQKITFPKNLNKIEFNVFYGCDSLKKLSFPAKLKKISSRAFYNCNSLVSVKIDRKNKHLKSQSNAILSKNGSKLICYPDIKRNTYTVPKTVKTIGESVFAECKNTKRIVLPNSVKKISAEAFDDCRAEIKLPSNLKIIESRGLARTNIRKFTVKPNMQIEKFALYGSKLKRLYIEKGVKKLPPFMAEAASKLKKVVIRDKNVKLSNSCLGYESSKNTITYYGVKFYGYKNSTAEKYVNAANKQQNGIEYFKFIEL